MLMTTEIGKPHHPIITGQHVKKDAHWWTEWNLENWARVLSSGGLPDGAPGEACAGENFTSLDLDNDIAFDRMCESLAETTGIVVAALPEPQCQAIRHRYLGERYEWEKGIGPYGVNLALAMPTMTEGLRARGVWLGE